VKQIDEDSGKGDNPLQSEQGNYRTRGKGAPTASYEITQTTVLQREESGAAREGVRERHQKEGEKFTTVKALRDMGDQVSRKPTNPTN